MTTTNLLTRMLEMFELDLAPQMFLSSFFKTRPKSYYDGEDIEIDIKRFDEGMSIPVPDTESGYREIESTQFVNKKYKAPSYKDSFALKSRDMDLRQPGQNPYTDPRFMANFTEKSFEMFQKLMERVERAVEDMAAQVLTTGKITLTDGTDTIYSIDYKPKTTHFTTAGVPWSTIATSDPIGDLAPLCQVIRDDGLTSNLTSLWDTDSFEFAMQSTKFTARLSTERRINLGAIVPLRQGVRGEQYRGAINLGNFELDIWTYNGRRIGPDGTTKGPYVPRKKVIVFDPNARYDATYGSGNKRLVPIDPRLSRFVPPVLRSSKSGVQLTTNAWVDPSAECFWGAASVRPLLIPVHIDAIGCLDTDLA